MRIIKVKDYEQMSRKTANIISAQVILKPDCVLGLATGSTPVGTYKQLIEWYQKKDIDFCEVTTFNLDEYVGLSFDSSQSYHYYMNKTFFSQINVDMKNTHIPDGMNANAAEECRRYDEKIRSCGGIDLQLLGIGLDGHIGFNEPGTSFELGTHCATLTESTIRANERFFEKAEDVPKFAYTMGMKSIMQAKKILLIANGENKAEILKEAFLGQITPQVPASILQLHNDVTLIVDEASGKFL